MTTVAQAEASRTQAQAEASRLNGAKSRGPATAEGRERSRWNALKHGLAAEKVVVLDEEAAAYEEYRQAFYEDQQPAGALEAALVERIAVINWRLRRAVWMEADLIQRDQWKAHEQATQWKSQEVKATWRPPSPAIMGERLERSLTGPNCPYDTVGRYERRLERGLFQTMRELRELRREQRRGDAGRKEGRGERGEGRHGEEEQRRAGAFSRQPEASAYSAYEPDPFADRSGEPAPPGKRKVRTWHYGPEYPGGCLLEERWVDVENCGMRISDCGLKTASSGNETSPAAEADNPKCEIRNPQLSVPPSEVIAEGWLADETAAAVPADAPASEAADPAPAVAAEAARAPTKA